MKYPLLLVLSLFVWEALSEECKKVSGRNCECRTSKHIIDLSPKGAQSKLLFINQTGATQSDKYYSYDPCDPLTPTEGLPAECKGAAVCQIMTATSVIAGDFTNVQFSGDPDLGTLKVTYDGFDSRKSIVKLDCGSDSFEVLEETPEKTYNFKLTTNRVPCANGSGGGLSPGSILLIVFFVLLLIYIIGGILYLRFAHGARGVEQIPNYDFWIELPALIRDGVVFVSRGCKPEPSYQQI